jgi:hypothetical protein
MQHGPDATRPFQKMHVDLFVYAGQNYLVATDEFTGWPCLAELAKDTTSKHVIESLRSIFLAHATPVVLRPDGGRQLVSEAVEKFLKDWGVALEPSSPHLPRTNGRAEAAVKFCKKLVAGCVPHGAVKPDLDKLARGIIVFRNTPRYGGRSPAELLFGHNVKDGVPSHHRSYDPRWRKAFRELDEIAENNKGKLEQRYDSHAKPLQRMPVGTTVWVQHHSTKRWTIPGLIVEALPKHEYMVRQASGRTLRRNRVLLRKRSFVCAPMAPGAVPATPALPPSRPALAPPPRATGGSTTPVAEQPTAPAPSPGPSGTQPPPPAEKKKKKTKGASKAPAPAPTRKSERTPKVSTKYPASKWTK